MERKIVDDLVNELIKEVELYDTGASEFIYKAVEYALKVHKGQKRKSGEPYIIHPLSVALILARECLDKDTICASILHDVREDGVGITGNDIEREFNSTVAMLVDGVTKMDKELFPDKMAQNYANIRKLLMSATRDVRVDFLKLADRLHNMMTLEHLPLNKRKENAIETLALFCPLARKIGMHKWEKMLGNYALQYVNPDVYQKILELREFVVYRDQDVLEEMQRNISNKLTELGIISKIDSRFKDVYSIFDKMFLRDISLSEINKISIDDILASQILDNEIHDMRSMGIVVPTKDDCYSSWDFFKEEFSICSGKTKDCIENPKTNMYRALHATIDGIDGWPVQTRICTDQMRRVNTMGLAAYFSEDSSTAVYQANCALKELPFTKSLIELNGNIPEDELFVTIAMKEIFSNMIYPVTSDGSYVELPLHSTPIDFAYKTNPSMVGYFSLIAMVNGRSVDFDYRLKSNDLVEIIPIINRNVANAKEDYSTYATLYPAKRIIKARRFMV